MGKRKKKNRYRYEIDIVKRIEISGQAPMPVSTKDRFRLFHPAINKYLESFKDFDIISASFFDVDNQKFIHQFNENNDTFNAGLNVKDNDGS